MKKCTVSLVLQELCVCLASITDKVLTWVATVTFANLV